MCIRDSRKKVQTILEMVHYQPNLMARSLASKKQYHFVAITPSFTHGEYWLSLIHIFVFHVQQKPDSWKVIFITLFTVSVVMLK